MPTGNGRLEPEWSDGNRNGVGVWVVGRGGLWSRELVWGEGWGMGCGGVWGRVWVVGSGCGYGLGCGLGCGDWGVDLGMGCGVGCVLALLYSKHDIDLMLPSFPGCIVCFPGCVVYVR